jgi:hypothetical protein
LSRRHHAKRQGLRWTKRIFQTGRRGAALLSDRCTCSNDRIV